MRKACPVGAKALTVNPGGGSPASGGKKPSWGRSSKLCKQREALQTAQCVRQLQTKQRLALYTEDVPPSGTLGADPDQSHKQKIRDSAPGRERGSVPCFSDIVVVGRLLAQTPATDTSVSHALPSPKRTGGWASPQFLPQSSWLGPLSVVAAWTTH